MPKSKPVNEMKEIAENMLIEKAVNHPNHYAESCSIECIEAMELAFGKTSIYAFCMCNAFKYLWRHKHKGTPKTDLKKAKWYLDKAESIYDQCPTNFSYCKIDSLKELIAKYQKEAEDG